MQGRLSDEATKLKQVMKIKNSTINQSVTVVIPTYNRGHLLNETIPTYLQPGVFQIVVINDNSTDNTLEVLAELKRNHPAISFISNSRNLKQTGSKNAGINLASTEYIYFGDDDSYITGDSILHLVDVMRQKNCDIVASRSLYLDENEDESRLFDRCDIPALSVKDIVDINSFNIDFTKTTDEPMEVPFSQACFLIKTDLAKKIKFSRMYIGNCFREETDFLIRCNMAGAKIFYTSRACQINLPRSRASGGAHSANRIIKRFYTLVNDLIFVIKNFNRLFALSGSILTPFMVLLKPYGRALKLLSKRSNVSKKKKLYS